MVIRADKESRFYSQSRVQQTTTPGHYCTITQLEFVLQVPETGDDGTLEFEGRVEVEEEEGRWVYVCVYV
jgi:hypothetical protein